MNVTFKKLKYQVHERFNSMGSLSYSISQISHVFLLLTELEQRLDFQLREGKMEHAYLAALTAHTSYWLNQDVAMFMMTQLFSEYGPKS